MARLDNNLEQIEQILDIVSDNFEKDQDSRKFEIENFDYASFGLNSKDFCCFHFSENY
jgi:hypothetical protein